MRDVCEVLVTSRPPFYLQMQQEFHFLPNSLIAVRITGFSVHVDDTFVEDETILFDAWNHFDTFLFQVSLKIIRRPTLVVRRYAVGSPIQPKYCLSWSENSGQLPRKHSG